MLIDTTTTIADRVARGMWRAKGANTSTMARSTNAWAMPATGVRPPVRTLVAVRAMAPVAAKPPKSGATRLARPWAMSSWLGSWRSSMAESATRADSSDSMAPRSAMVSAGEISLPSVARESSGSPMAGSSWGMPLKRLPMVSTGSCRMALAAVASTSTPSGPGSRPTAG